MKLLSTEVLLSLEQTLSAVTGQDYRREMTQNTTANFLCAWRNETCVDYILHIMNKTYNTWQVCFAVQRYKDIITRYDHTLNTTEMKRLLTDPRLCVKYWVGQIRDV